MGGCGAIVIVFVGFDLGVKMFVFIDGLIEGIFGDFVFDEVAVCYVDELMWIECFELCEVGDVTLFVDVMFLFLWLIIFGAVDFVVVLCCFVRVAGWCLYVVDLWACFV